MGESSVTISAAFTLFSGSQIRLRPTLTFQAQNPGHKKISLGGFLSSIGILFSQIVLTNIASQSDSTKCLCYASSILQG